MTDIEAYHLMDKSLCYEKFYLLRIMDMKILTCNRQKAINIFLHNLALEPGVDENCKGFDSDYEDGYGNKLESILRNGEAHYDDHFLDILPMRLDREYFYVW